MTETMPPDRLTRKTPNVLPSSEDKEIYFVRALYQGKARCAWWMANYLEPARVWELLDWYQHHVVAEREKCLQALRDYEALLGYSSQEYDVVTRCAAVLLMCLSPSLYRESMRPLVTSMDTRVNNMIQEWKTVVGTIKARVYTLPTTSLYGTTVRGRSLWSQHNRVQLYHVEKYLVGCPFWDEALETYADVEESGGIRWHSEDAMEAFYERYFPDDIPDEWTREEKGKSHGDGVLGPDEAVSLWKYASRYLSGVARFAWGLTPSMLRTLRSLPSSDECSPLSLLSSYSSPLPWKENLTALLTPVHKQKVVG
jgi:hypothetical protein